MGRTLLGSLTGKAAQIDRQDRLEEIITQPSNFSYRYQAAVNKLISLMGDREFDKFYDSFPDNMSKGKFLKIMLDQIDTLSAWLAFAEENASAFA